MSKPTPKDEEREVRLANIREKIACGEYRVDPHVVAEAIVRRLAEPPSGGHHKGGAGAAQNECSNPASSV
jgi:hypothetical protein